MSPPSKIIINYHHSAFFYDICFVNTSTELIQQPLNPFKNSGFSFISQVGKARGD